MLQATLNRFINRNPHYLLYLKEMAGQSIAISFSDLPLKYTFCCQSSFVEVRSGMHDAALFLEASVIDFMIFLAKPNQRQKLLQQGKVQFSGDLHVLEKLEAFLGHFQLGFLRFLPQRRIQQFLYNQIEYWQEEKQILASPVLSDSFKEEVFLLRQELDRCATRLQALEVYEL